MRRPWFWVLVLLAAVTGFVLGRATGTAPLVGLTAIHKDFPLFPAPPKPDVPAPVNAAPAPEQESDIIVEVPVDGTIVSDTFVDVAGRAVTSGGPLRIVVKDAAGTVLASADADLAGGDGAAYGRFGATLTFNDKPAPGAGTVEITRSITGGQPIVRHIAFAAPGGGGLTVKAYFRASGDAACDQVAAVTRPFDGKTAVYRAAIEELLKGPSADEKAGGYATAVPSGVTLKSVAADADGLVTADFTQTLTRGVTDPCRASTIRAQIESTLRQFPEVHGVVISVNGKTDGVLRP